MSEDKTTQPENTSDSDIKEEKNDGETTKSFTQEDLNKVVSKRLAEEKEKLSKEFQEKLAKEKSEAERLAQLSAEQREKEIFEKQKEEVSAKNKELTLRENKIQALEKFGELKLPNKFVELVLDENPEVMEKRIESFHKEWTDAIQAEVTSQLAGKAPIDPNKGNARGSVGIKTSF